MTKEQAIEILNNLTFQSTAERATGRVLIEAIADAGAFTDGTVRCPDCHDGGACLPGGCGVPGCTRCGKACPTCNGSCEVAWPYRPVATCSKARAEEILNLFLPKGHGDRADDERRGALDFFAALDRARSFPSEEVLEEIASVASTLLDVGDRAEPELVRRWALRLATACRAAGLVKP